MKTLILFSSVMLLFSCNGNMIVDHEYTAAYQYKNGTSKELTFTLNEKKDTVVLLKSLEYCEFRIISNDDFHDPQDFRGIGVVAAMIVSDGEKQVVFSWKSGNDKLFFKENYELIKSTPGYRLYSYTFTDHDFENGEPLEP